MPGIGALIATIISCAVGVCGVLFFAIGSLRREIGSLRTELTTAIGSLRTELTAVIKAEVGALRTEIATARAEEFKQRLLNK